MTDTHPTSPRGAPPARSWGRRLAAFSAALALSFGGLASAAENPWQSRGEAKTPDAQLLGSPITMTLVDNNGGDLELNDEVTVTANVPGSLGGGDFDLWACPDQTLLPRDNGDSGACVGPNIQDQTGDSTTFTLDSQYANFCNWYVVVHDYPSGGHSNWVGPLLGVNNCENSLPGTPPAAECAGRRCSHRPSHGDLDGACRWRLADHRLHRGAVHQRWRLMVAGCRRLRSCDHGSLDGHQLCGQPADRRHRLRVPRPRHQWCGCRCIQPGQRHRDAAGDQPAGCAHRSQRDRQQSVRPGQLDGTH